MTEPVTTHVEYGREVGTGDIIFSGRITQHDLVKVKFDRLDLACISSEAKTPADTLQNLEIMFRCMGEQNV